MSAAMDRLLTQYEGGRITRREYLARVSGLVVAARAATASDPAISTVKQLNHVTIFVRDVQRSRTFYQELFGMPLLTPQDPGVNLKAGDGFLGIYPAQDRTLGINHVCFGLDNFDADAVLKKLTQRGLNGNIRLRGDTKELYFSDPDNIRVQLQDARYIGGVGPLGDRPPK
jgi:catechol 2,3-dioxygenase-like lactoylglutathione lyase family enzyme